MTKDTEGEAAAWKVWLIVAAFVGVLGYFLIFGSQRQVDRIGARFVWIAILAVVIAVVGVGWGVISEAISRRRQERSRVDHASLIDHNPNPDARTIGYRLAARMIAVGCYGGDVKVIFGDRPTVISPPSPTEEEVRAEAHRLRHKYGVLLTPAEISGEIQARPIAWHQHWSTT
jgi:hypothetical protein